MPTDDSTESGARLPWPARSGPWLRRFRGSTVAARDAPPSAATEPPIQVVNGYRVSELVKDPVLVLRSLAEIAALLTSGREQMQRFGRPDLADGLLHLSRRLRDQGAAIDDAFERDFLAITTDVADVCQEARAQDADDLVVYRLLEDLGWIIVDLVVVRVGGTGTFHHGRGAPPQNL